MELVGIILLVLATCLILGIPIAFSIGIASFIGLTVGGMPIELLGQGAFAALDDYVIMAVPLFILTGVLMESGGLSRRLINFARSLIGNVSGGLAIVTVLASGLFAAISGSSPATVAAIGTIMIPTMVKHGYAKGFASAVPATAGSLGIIIPPSITMIIFGTLAGVSVSDMFIAGLMPGIFIIIILCVTVYLIAKKRGYTETNEPFSFTEVFKSFWEAKWALLAPIIILGGIYSGVFTPTEAGVVAVVYGFIIALFVYRELKWNKVPEVFIDAATTTGAVLIILSTATTFGQVFIFEQVPQMLADGLMGITESPFLMLLLIAAMMVILGTFMEALSLIIILTPILLPVVDAMGVDPIHFGMIMIIGASIGQKTPPVGVNLFVASGVSGVSIERLSLAMLPFLFVILLVYLVIIFFPPLTTWLVDILG